MGFFGKKKKQQQFVEPLYDESQYEAPSEIPAELPSPHSVPTPSMVLGATEAVVNEILGDEELAVPAPPTPVPTPTPSETPEEASPPDLSPSDFSPSDFSPTNTADSGTHGGDEPTFDDGRTYKTDYTYPTGKSVRSEATKDSAFTITRNGEYLTMNDFANAHLLRWKFAAEEGPVLIRLPAVLLAVAVIGTTLYPFVTIPDFWTVPTMICCFHTCVLAFLILILEGRVFCGIRSPINARARLRFLVTRYLNICRLLWGRGLLYIFAGTMNLTISHQYTLYSGLSLMGLGVLAICSGAHASYNLDKVKSSLTSEAYLWGQFDACDDDKDNLIDMNGFAELIWALGLELDDAYTHKAFSQIDRQENAKISFEQFRDWWIVAQNNGRSLRNMRR